MAAINVWTSPDIHGAVTTSEHTKVMSSIFMCPCVNKVLLKKCLLLIKLKAYIWWLFNKIIPVILDSNLTTSRQAIEDTEVISSQFLWEFGGFSNLWGGYTTHKNSNMVWYFNDNISRLIIFEFDNF